MSKSAGKRNREEVPCHICEEIFVEGDILDIIDIGTGSCLSDGYVDADAPTVRVAIHKNCKGEVAVTRMRGE